MTNELQLTLGNKDWLRKNETALKAMLPTTWTHIQNLKGLGIGYKLKLLGVDWRSEQQFGQAMVYLERIGIMLRDGLAIKANPRSIFDGE